MTNEETIPDTSETPGDDLAIRLIDAWCFEHKRQIPWQKAIEIVAITTKMDDAERLRLLGLGDEDEPLAPVAQIVLEDAGQPFKATSVRMHFFKEVPPPGTLLYLGPQPNLTPGGRVEV